VKICIAQGFMFGQVPWERAIEAIAGIGYRHLEVHFGSHGVTLDATDEQLEAKRRVLEQHGVEAHAFFGYARLASPDEAVRAQGVREMQRQIAMARLFGCDLLTTEMSGGNTTRADDCRRSFQRSVEELIPLLEAAGVRASFMPHPGDFVEEHYPALEILRAFRSDRIGYLYSCPHTYIMGGDAPRMLEDAADLLTHVQVADTFRQERFVVAYAPEGYINMLKDPKYAGVMNAHLHLVLGRGELDFPGIFRALARIGYQGALSAIPFGVDDPVELARESYQRIAAYVASQAGATTPA
jgi:myo-inositol catabolism protein IolH